MNTCRRFSENDVEDPDDARNKVTDKQSSKHSNNGWGSVHQCDRLCWWKLSRKVILGGDQNSAEEKKMISLWRSTKRPMYQVSRISNKAPRLDCNLLQSQGEGKI